MIPPEFASFRRIPFRENKWDLQNQRVFGIYPRLLHKTFSSETFQSKFPGDPFKAFRSVDDEEFCQTYFFLNFGGRFRRSIAALFDYFDREGQICRPELLAVSSSVALKQVSSFLDSLESRNRINLSRPSLESVFHFPAREQNESPQYQEIRPDNSQVRTFRPWESVLGNMIWNFQSKNPEIVWVHDLGMMEDKSSFASYLQSVDPSRFLVRHYPCVIESTHGFDCVVFDLTSLTEELFPNEIMEYIAWKIWKLQRTKEGESPSYVFLANFSSRCYEACGVGKRCRIDPYDHTLVEILT